MSTTAQPQSSATITDFKPYIFFYGRCEEALEFYKNVFGGTYEMQKIEDSPMADHVPPEFRDKVMHATFTAPGLSFFASDGQDAKAIDPQAGNISLAFSTADAATGDRVFAALAGGGKITGELQPAFWGGRFGSIEDKFGIEWYVTTP